MKHICYLFLFASFLVSASPLLHAQSRTVSRTRTRVSQSVQRATALRKFSAQHQMERYKRQLQHAPAKTSSGTTQFIRSGARVSISQSFLQSSSFEFWDDMENGTNGWTTDPSTGALWHLTTSDYSSPTHSWWAGDENSGTYDNGNRVDQSLISPAIDLSNVTAPIALTFLEEFITESGKDRCMVDATTDGGSSWVHLRDSASGNSGGWIYSTLSLNAFAGKTIRIRFHFDTDDELFNDFPGWFIDDVDVLGEPGYVDGSVYFDENRDQSYDNGDSPLFGWIVTATAVGIAETTMTDGNGSYSFVLPAGNYTIAENLPSDWSQVMPASGSYTIAIVGPGDDFSGLDFGDWHPDVTISGYAFADDNRNGIQDGSEVLVPNQWIEITGGPGNSIDDEVHTDQTGHFSYLISDLGTYTFTQEAYAPYDFQTLPANGQPYTIAVSTFAENIPPLAFGNVYPARAPWVISGVIFADDNKNAIRDNGEIAVSGQAVEISGGADTKIDVETSTDAGGHFSYAVFDTGTYHVSQDLNQGDFQTLPARGSECTIDVRVSDDTLQGMVFGIFSSSRVPWIISGSVFADNNRNGIRDSGEVPIPNHSVEISGGHDFYVDDQVQTDAAGHFTYAAHDTGIFHVLQHLNGGEIQTLPANGSGYTPDVHFMDDTLSGNIFGTFSPIYASSVISGYVFADNNHNGILDNGEVLMANQLISIRGGREFPVDDEIATDRTGHFSYSVVDTGIYILAQELDEGNFQSLPSGGGSYSIDIPWYRDSIRGIAFGTIDPSRAPWILSGRVFEDGNRNGTQDAGENLVSRQGIRITGTTKYSGGDTWTDASGHFSYAVTDTGMFYVSQILSADALQTFPPSDSEYTIHVQIYPDSTQGIVFGTFFPSRSTSVISGYVFADDNRNGNLDNGEVFMARQSIIIKGGKDNPVNDEISTDASGHFSYTVIDTGIYTLSQDLQEGDIQTFPPAGSSNLVDIPSYRDTLSGIAFGTFYPSHAASVISGYVFADDNRNGIQDNGEVLMPNQSITITGGNDYPVNANIKTRVDGRFSYSVVDTGVYTVSQNLQSGSFQSHPPNGNPYLIHVQSYRDSISGIAFGNVFTSRVPWIISGYVFADDNHNGIQDGGEILLPNMSIRIRHPYINTYVTTDSTGHFSFTATDTGRYIVSQILSPGNFQSFPAGKDGDTLQIQLLTDTLPRIIFGTILTPRSPWVISGYVFADDNHNGILDGREILLSNRPIVIQDPSHHHFFLTTDLTGHFSFAATDTGRYIVSQNLSSGEFQSFPSGKDGDTLHIQPLVDTLSGIVFGTILTSQAPWVLSGFVFADDNRNGLLDSGEVFLSNQSIKIDGGARVHFRVTVMTDNTGHFSFGAVDTGSYSISQVLTSDEIQTFPANPGAQTITLHLFTDTVQAIRFGTFLLSRALCSISGVVFADTNMNGVFDAGEPGFASASISLHGSERYDTQTGSDGSYSFAGVLPGNYTLSAKLSESGWATTPVQGYAYNFVIKTNVSGANFAETPSRFGTIKGTIFSDADRDGHKELRESGIERFRVFLSDSMSVGTRLNSSTITDSEGHYAFSNLWPGSCTVTEEDQPSWVPTAPHPASYTLSVKSGTIKSKIDFGNYHFIPDSEGYRSFTYENLAVTKDYKGTVKWVPIRTLYPTQLTFEGSAQNKDRTGHIGASLHLEFKLPLADSLVTMPWGSQTTTGTTSVDIAFPGGILPGQRVSISGIANELALGKRDRQKITAAEWKPADNSAPFRAWVALSSSFSAYIPPNEVDVLIALRGHSIDVGNLVRLSNYIAIGKSLSYQGLLHSGPPRCLGYYSPGHIILKTQFSLPPKYPETSNKLFGETIALKVNILASDLGITPRGFGELIYDEGGANPLNGKSVRVISSVLEKYMSSNDYRPMNVDFSGTVHCHMPAGYEWLDSLRLWQTIRTIDSSFVGPISTKRLAWSSRSAVDIALTSVRSITTSPYLRFDTSFARIGTNEAEVADLHLEPEGFSLMQNYPNPFNPVTTIEFNLPEASIVTLKVYNILGQEVATLVDREPFQTGYQEVRFLANGLASGVYFYRITAESLDDNGTPTGQSFVQVKKMILLK